MPSQLTHNPSIAAQAVLAPKALVSPDDILGLTEQRAISHGVYGWWFDHSLPLAPRDGCLRLGGKDLLYIGIAPPKNRPMRPNGPTPIKSRLWQNHLRGSVRCSTLRLSLAALLQDDFALAFWRDARGRVRMDRHHEQRLTDWIESHAAISIMQHDEPWSLEETLIRKGPALPLNLSMSGHPFRTTLRRLRCALGRD